MDQIPYSEEAEDNVIASIIVDPDNARYVEKLTEKDFYITRNNTIFKLIEELYKNKSPIDILTVKEKGVSKKIKSEALLNELSKITDKLITSARIEYYIKIIKNLSMKRQIMQASNEIFKDSLNADNEIDETELKNDAIQKLIKLKTQTINQDGEMTNVIFNTIQNIEKKYRKRDDLTYRTGFFDVDKITDGLHEQELTIIAARPGVGKTAFALQMAEYIAKKGVYTYFVSLEMSETQLGNRMIARNAEIDGHKLRLGLLLEEDFAKISEAAGEIANIPLFIDSKSSTIQEIESMAIELKTEKNMGLIVIDYLQLLKSKNKFSLRHEEVAEISRKLKLMSKNLNIPIIACCQLNRETEKRKRPMLSDLRESGSIEQDADNVIFLYAEEEEKIKQFVMNIEVIVAKQRNGPVGTIKLSFNKRQMKFNNLAGGI